MSELIGAVESAVQVTVGNKIASFLAVYIASPAKRALLYVGVSILLYLSPLRSSLALDLCLLVTASTLLGLLTQGFDMVSTLSHACIFLLVAEKVVAKGLPESFVSNAQYLFANAVTSAFVSSPLHRIFAVVAALGGSALIRPASPLLATGLVMAATGIVKGILVDAIPVALKLPTVLAITCFAKPLSTHRLLGPRLYNFALYLSGDTLQQALQPPHVAFLVCVCLYFVSPTQTYQAVAQIACVGVATDMVITAIQYIAAKADPVPAFVAVLVIARVAIAVFHRLHWGE